MKTQSCHLFRDFVPLLFFFTAGLLSMPQSAAAACTAPPPGMVGWWRGEGNAQDATGAHHGYLRGGATANEAGYVGNGFSLDGTNRYVEIPDSPALKPAQLTVECWVRFDNLDAPGTSVYPGQQYLVFKQNTRSQDFEAYVLSKDRTHADIILWEVTSASGELVRIDSLSPVQTNVWYHLAGVRGSDYIELYFNGVLEARAQVDFPQDYGDEPLYFGTSGQSFYDRKLNGMLDEVALYNRALSAQEIRALYLAGREGKCQVATAGSYYGLFTGETVANPGSGAINLTMTSKGAFSGKLSFEDGSTRSLKGRFDSSGACTLRLLKGKGASAIPLTLTLDHQEGDIFGSLTGASGTATVSANRSAWHPTSNPFPKAGRYTLTIPGMPGSATEPGGSSHATVRVRDSGKVVLRGYLGDGTAFTQKTRVTANGHWPFYSRLYSSRGSIMGWVSFESDAETDLAGRLVWTRPANSRARYYPAGFLVEGDLVGSVFTPPAKGQPLIDLPLGVIAWEGGNLPALLDNGIQFGPGSSINADLGPNRMRASFSRSSGGFTGKIIEDTTLKFSGVLLQKQKRGAGFFRGQDQTGNVTVSAAPDL